MQCSFCNIYIDSSNLEHWYVNNGKYQCRFRRKASKDAWYIRNKASENKKSRLRYSQNRTDELLKMKAWYEKNKASRSHSMKVWRQRNRQYLNEYYRYKKASDIEYRLACCIRSRLSISISRRAMYKSGSSIENLGCSIPELKKHLESKFTEGMSWDNYGLHGWHIDHIKPLSSFDLSNPEELKEACHYTNLQPLWARDNLSKGDKYEA